MLKDFFPLQSETYAWLRLSLIPNVRVDYWLGLINHFGITANRIVNEQWCQIPPSIKLQLAHIMSTDTSGEEKRVCDWLSSSQLHQVISYSDKDYPEAWKRLSHPPLTIFASGNRNCLDTNMFAVVGSRNATPSGLKNADYFSKVLSEAGFTVLSGLALGVDGAAHQAALNTKSSTVAILGCGPDIVYPRRHRSLFGRIVNEGGMVLSEFLPGTPPLKHHFPQRNRLIGSMATGTLVIEAALKSGSLITAQVAVDHGRDVFAVPGSINNPKTAGCHRLIQQGAKLVADVSDILEEYRGFTQTSHASIHPLGEKKLQQCLALDPILDSVDYEPTSVDVIISRSKRTASEVVSKLLELELDGFVAPFCGGYIKLRG